MFQLMNCLKIKKRAEIQLFFDYHIKLPLTTVKQFLSEEARHTRRYGRVKDIKLIIKRESRKSALLNFCYLIIYRNIFREDREMRRCVVLCSFGVFHFYNLIIFIFITEKSVMQFEIIFIPNKAKVSF